MSIPSISIPATPADHQPQAAFCKLPREIRDLIFQACFHSSNIIVDEPIPSKVAGLKANIAATSYERQRSLALVSRQFYLDVTYGLLSNSNCHIYGDDALQPEDPVRYVNEVAQAINNIYPTSKFGFHNIRRISIKWDNFPLDASRMQGLSTILEALSDLTHMTQLSLSIDDIECDYSASRQSDYLAIAETTIRTVMATRFWAKNVCVAFGWRRPEGETLKLPSNTRVHRNARQFQADGTLEYTNETYDGTVTKFVERCRHCNDKRLTNCNSRTKRIRGSQPTG